MRTHSVNSGAPRRTVGALMIALAVGQACAAPVVYGDAGVDGIRGSAPGVPGTGGSAGGDAVALAGVLDSAAVADGGRGGQGGSGGNGVPPGRGGDGGNGGFAEARHIVHAQEAQLVAKATATGGRGGNGGSGGNRWDPPLPVGESGYGGVAGNALAVVDVAGTGAVKGTASATGGQAVNRSASDAGGNAAVALRGVGNTVVLTGTAAGGDNAGEWRTGGTGMIVSTASGTLEGTAGSGGLNGTLKLLGGWGASQSNSVGIRSGNGGDAIARNPFNVSTIGALVLTLTGEGGRGGDTATGIGGRGGNADLNATVDGGSASSVTATVLATGGRAGTALNGGSLVTSAASLSAAGMGKASLQASGTGPVKVIVEGVGGAGGLHLKGDGSDGGLGVAHAAATTSGTELASSVARATGGQGGEGFGQGAPGGGNRSRGGSAQGSAYAYNSGNGPAEASLTLQGGKGGYRKTAGGKGGDVVAVNNVGGSSEGKLRLEQRAFGGHGGASERGFVSGDGGMAVSRLSLTDIRSSELSVSLVAVGGNASVGERLGKGGTAQAELQLTSTKAGATVRGSVQVDSGRGLSATDGETLARSIISANGKVNNWVRASSNNGSEWDTSAFGRSASHGDVNTDVGSDRGKVSRARAESISTGGTATAVASGRGETLDASAYSAARGKAQSLAIVQGQATRLVSQATSVSTFDRLTVETSASRVAVDDYGYHLKLSASTNIAGVKPGDGEYFQMLSAASFQPADGTPLDRTPTVAAAFQSIDLVGEGVMYTGSPTAMTAEEHQRTTASFHFDTLADGSLTLGLIGFNRSEQFLGQLGLSVFSHGTELFSHTFSSMDEADMFFHDSALSLGPLTAGSQDIMIAADFLFNDRGSAGFRYVLGVEALAPVPEPGTWVMLLLGLTLIIVRVRRPQRG